MVYRLRFSCNPDLFLWISKGKDSVLYVLYGLSSIYIYQLYLFFLPSFLSVHSKQMQCEFAMNQANTSLRVDPN